MNIEWAFIYGLIQGVSEFLPISSSGHLALIPYFMKLEDPGVLFDLMMHLGTAFAVILYFRKEVGELFMQAKYFIFKEQGRDTSFLQNFAISTFFSVIFILILKNYAFEFGRLPLIIGINFVVFGLLMYLSDRRVGLDIDMTKSKRFNFAILIGIAQSLAVFPGVSRSGITLTVARSLQVNRYQASRYSFLLSLPIIIGSIVFKLPTLFSGENSFDAVVFLIAGIVFSFIFGIITIHFFLKLIAKIGLIYFAVYRVIVGGILIYLSLS